MVELRLSIERKRPVPAPSLALKVLDEVGIISNLLFGGPASDVQIRPEVEVQLRQRLDKLREAAEQRLGWSVNESLRRVTLEPGAIPDQR